MRHNSTSSAHYIEQVVERIPGWSPPDQLLVLHTLVLATASLGGDIIEFGSWCGRSTVVLAHAARNSGVGKVYAVDLFPELKDWYQNPDGSFSFSVDLDGSQVSGHVQQTVWSDPFEEQVKPAYRTNPSTYAMFTQAISNEGLEQWVDAYRGTSTGFVEQKGLASPKARLVFVDADHSYEAVCKDIDSAERLLLPGGWVAFDDAFSSYAGVDEAIRERILDNPGYDQTTQPTRKMFLARRTQ